MLLKLLLKYSLNAYLAKYGETNPGEKWLFRKLSRYAEKHGDQHLLDKYLNLLCYPLRKIISNIMLKKLLILLNH